MLQPKKKSTSFLEIQLPLNEFDHKDLVYYFLCTFYSSGVAIAPYFRLNFTLVFYVNGKSFLVAS